MDIYLASIIGGLVGGVVFGRMMQRMGMLVMIAKLIGQSTNTAGWAAHLVFSGIIGFLYAASAVFFGLQESVAQLTSGLVVGAIYGAIWWILGASIIMPIWMRMRPKLSSMQSLMGHVIYGLLLGATVSWLV